MSSELHAPTIERVGDVWRVTYAGMVKEHRQEWQARWQYDRACEVYLAFTRGDT